MPNYKRSQVLSLRIDRALLEAVRERAFAEGRSVSGQIVYLVREQVGEREGGPPRQPKKISGWLSRRGAPPTLDEFRSGRTLVSKGLRAAVKRKARKK